MTSVVDDADHVQGWSAIPNWLVRDESISGRAKLVYMCLNSRASRHGEAFPSHARIAKESGMSVSSVKVALNELRDKKIVRWEKQQREDGAQWNNRYYLASSFATPSQNAATP